MYFATWRGKYGPEGLPYLPDGRARTVYPRGTVVLKVVSVQILRKVDICQEYFCRERIYRNKGAKPPALAYCSLRDEYKHGDENTVQSLQPLHTVHFVMKSNRIMKNEFYEINSSIEFFDLVLKSVNTNDKECYRQRQPVTNQRLW